MNSDGFRERDKRGNNQIGSSRPLKFYTVKQVADIFAVSERTVRRWITQRSLIAHPFGRVNKQSAVTVVSTEDIDDVEIARKHQRVIHGATLEVTAIAQDLCRRLAAVNAFAFGQPISGFALSGKKFAGEDQCQGEIISRPSRSNPTWPRDTRPPTPIGD